jgi:hypothetical protein
MRLRSVLATVSAGPAAATCVTAAAPVNAQSGTAPGVHACSPAVSITSYSDALDKTTYDGIFVGNLSALAVDRGGRIAAACGSPARRSSPTSATPRTPAVSTP